MTTPLFLLRCVQLGISIRDLELLTIGMVNDMYVESRNDGCPEAYVELATQADLIVPIEECFNDSYFILNFLYEKSLEKVEYTDDPKRLSPKVFTIGNEEIKLASAKLGKYKNTYWEFQNEERYVLRFLPVDVK